MATVPTVDVTFKQLATTLISRSERGSAILILKDEYLNDDTLVQVYKDTTQLNSSYDGYFFSDEWEDGNGSTSYSTLRATNLKYIKYALSANPYELVVIYYKVSRYPAFQLLKATRTQGWIAIPGSTSVEAELASWIVSMESEQGYSYKGVGCVADKDCMHWVYVNQKAVDTDGEELAECELSAVMVGVLAACNCTRSLTNYTISALSEVTELGAASSVETTTELIQEAMDKGQLVLTNTSDGVKPVSGINSLVTLNGSTATEDMQYIETVEVMDLIKDDIRTEFINTYQGAFKNKYANQLLFIGAINAYFDDLAAEDLLDSEFDNVAEIDVDTQRSAWVASGNTDAEDWDNDYVKSMSYKRSVFLLGNIKILNCMENLQFIITLE